MKRATVVCSMDPFRLGLATPQEMEGWACIVVGIDMVAHRLPRVGQKPHSRLWTVTEPVTGRGVATAGSRCKAIEAAEEAILLHGGPEAVKREIAKHGPAPSPSKTKAAQQ